MKFNHKCIENESHHKIYRSSRNHITKKRGNKIPQITSIIDLKKITSLESKDVYS